MSVVKEGEGGAKKNTKKLSEEDTQAMVERLYGREIIRIEEKHKKFVEDIEFQSKHNDFSYRKIRHSLNEREMEIVKNCYENQMIRMEKKKLEQEMVRQKEMELMRKEISEEDAENMKVRLYNQSMENKKRQLEISTKKVYGDVGNIKNKPAPKRTKQQIEAAVDHLYTVGMEKKKTADALLEEKYGWKKNKTAELTQEELAQSAARLCTKNS